jgi:uncharacterized protein (DUF433 family)
MTIDKLRFDDDLEESPRVKGSRLSAIQIYEMHVLRGLTVNELVRKYEALDTDAVKQCLEYCVAHPDAVREQSTSQLTVEIAERQARTRGASA